MSGGSFNYIYTKIEDAAYLTEDEEISELLKDLSTLLHDEEWYHSGDYDEDKYKYSLAKFKKKWFTGSRETRLKEYIDKKINQLRDNLYSLVGDTK